MFVCLSDCVLWVFVVVFVFCELLSAFNVGKAQCIMITRIENIKNKENLLTIVNSGLDTFRTTLNLMVSPIWS